MVTGTRCELGALRSVDPGVVIDAAQAAWLEAEPTAEQLGYEFESMTLELSGVADFKAGAEVKFAIPVLGWEAGGSTSEEDAATLAIAVTLEPKINRTLAEDGARLKTALTEALAGIANVVSAGRNDGLQLKEASAVVEFAITEDWGVKFFILAAEAERVTTQKLTVKLRPASPADGHSEDGPLRHILRWAVLVPDV